MPVPYAWVQPECRTGTGHTAVAPADAASSLMADVGESMTSGWPVPSEEQPSVGRLMNRRRGIGRAVCRVLQTEMRGGDGEGEGRVIDALFP